MKLPEIPATATTATATTANAIAGTSAVTAASTPFKILNIEKQNSMLKRPLPPRPDEVHMLNATDADDEQEEDDDDDDEDHAAARREPAMKNDAATKYLMPEDYVYEEPTMQESITAVVVVAATASGNSGNINNDNIGGTASC